MVAPPHTEDSSAPLPQASAVPFRRRDGQIEFCVITSTRGRWLFPKGFIDPGDGPAETALKEAYEEAGLHGRIVGEPLGCYEVVRDGQTLAVVALLMEVRQSDPTWPEQATRQRRWVTEAGARELFTDSHLIDMLTVAVERIANHETDE